MQRHGRRLAIAAVLVVGLGCRAGDRDDARTDLGTSSDAGSDTPEPTGDTPSAALDAADAPDVAEAPDAADATTGADAQDADAQDADAQDADAQDSPEAPTPADDGGDTSPLSPQFRFAVVSDTHVYPVDDLHNRAFAAAGARLASLMPAVDFVVSTGDNIDDLYTLPETIEAGDPVEVLAVYRGLIETHYPMPFHVVKGNHDNRFLDTFQGNTLPDRAWAQAFAGTPFYPSPWYAFDHRGFHFVVLDTTDGATDHATNDTPTLRDAQAQWLTQELSLGLPTILFWHHWIPQPQPGAPLHPLMETIAQHKDVVRAAFMGHQHDFATYEWEGVRFHQSPALYQPGVAWHVVECDTATGDVRIANEADIP